MENNVNKFKEWMDKTGITMLDFAKICGVNVNTIYKAYRGIALYRKDPAKRISRHTKGAVTVQDLGLQ